MRHLNNGTDHRHTKSCCDQSSPARRTKTATGTRLLKWFVFFAVFCISLAQWDMNNMADVSKAISLISSWNFHSYFTYFSPKGLIRSKSSLVQVMAWRPTVGGMIYRHQAIHYLNQIDLSAMGLVAFRGWFNRIWPWQQAPDRKVQGANMGPPGSCRPQMGPMLAPWTLLSGALKWVLNITHS